MTKSQRRNIKNLRTTEHVKRSKSFVEHVDKLLNRARREGKTVVIRGIDGALVGGTISDPRIDRCNREIAEIERRIHAGEEPLDGLMLGLHDWKREKEMLEGGKR